MPRKKDAGTEDLGEMSARRNEPGDEVALSSTELAETADTAPPDRPGRSRVAGWRRLFAGNRALWVVAAIAILSLVAGLVLGRFVISPSDAAGNAEPPTAGLITVPVEYTELSNDVVIRGTVGYADAVDVTIDTTDVGGPAVVTGAVPAVGAVLGPLSIALEIAGRPVIVLPGDLPAYRTLRLGVSGPDVTQLKVALSIVGINPGDASSPVYDRSTAAAVAQLYAAVGYPPPSSPAGTADTIRAAEDGVRSARQQLAMAEQDLRDAGAGPGAIEIKEQDNLVASAQRALDTAKAEKPQDPDKIADLEDALALAILRRDAIYQPRDTSAQSAAVDAANQNLAWAEQSLDEAREGALAFLPANEALYLADLPRRVDEVTAKRGSILQGAAMRVSGAALLVTATAAEADAMLVTPGDEAFLDLPDGTVHRAIVTTVTPAAAGSGSAAGRWTITLTPDPLTAEQVTQLQGQNLRLSIPVGATTGAVLAVPIAALSAGPGGESRVEVVLDDPREADASTRIVVVETGLAAAGMVEITPIDGELVEGELVVVGR